jgi:hypothetical protein
LVAIQTWLLLSKVHKSSKATSIYIGLTFSQPLVPRNQE